jgi:hypothetical protein
MPCRSANSPRDNELVAMSRLINILLSPEWDNGRGQRNDPR